MMLLLLGKLQIIVGNKVIKIRKMKKIGLSFVLVTFFIVSYSQDVLKIGDRNISLDEFKSIFYKNNHDIEPTIEYLEEYMDLFVNFKLKVIEAEDLGLDTNRSFINELEGYRKQLAKPYLKNNEFDIQMLTESYNRMQKDVRASHILISVDGDATKNERMAEYNRALEIRESIIDGEISFAQAAKTYSSDKSALSNGGDLGYFTVFMMVYDFETVAYETPIGEVSMPVKTKYGYHLIQVNDIRDAVGEVKVAHIMFKTGKGADKEKISSAHDKIKKVVDLLKNNEEFADVAERFSEDRTTAVKGGNLPIFGVGKMVPEFEGIAFSLKNVGDVSEPFLTDYGWHIIKLIEKKPIPEFSKVESDLKRMIERDSRGELSQQALYKKLRSIYQVKNRPEIYSLFRKKAAFKVLEGKFRNSSINDTILLTINRVPVLVNEFVEYILLNQLKGSDIDQIYIDFVNQKLLAYEDSNLEEKYPEYKALLKEYREGILLFDLTNKNVWLKAVEDTVGLQIFFTSHQSSYIWDQRVDATMYWCADLVTGKKDRQDIYKKHRGYITNAEILERMNNENPLSLKIESKQFVKGENEYIDNLDLKIGIAKDIVLDNGSYILIDVNQVLPSGFKQLNEIRGKVISDYQDYLEAEWLSSLKSKYPVTINREVLHSLIK